MEVRYRLVAYFLVDYNNCAHQGQIEQESGDCACEQVAKGGDNHGVLCPVAPAPNRRSGLSDRVKQILFLK